ncbi:hypothetical protein ACQB6R_01795 [Propionibacteriaceae bacterium G1746]|uniref:hypothetical protein n=1 Tax=Aestuariimicrobium sp. G57 TaxID=3418485 RepID=UPI003C260A49
MSEKVVSRRTVATGIAWSVPAVAVASAVPAYAVSGTPPTIKGGKAYKWPGNSCPGTPTFTDAQKAYLFTFRVTNTSDKTIYLYSATITTTTTGLTFNVIGATPAFGTPIPPGGTVDVGLFANGSDSGNLTFTATASIEWGHNYPGPDPDNHAPVTLTWRICGTPTLQSAGFPACTNPGYQAPQADCVVP